MDRHPKDCVNVLSSMRETVLHTNRATQRPDWDDTILGENFDFNNVKVIHRERDLGKRRFTYNVSTKFPCNLKEDIT